MTNPVAHTQVTIRLAIVAALPKNGEMHSRQNPKLRLKANTARGG